MNKQIEEMARDIFESRVAIDGIDLAFATVYGADMVDSHFMRIAKHLVCNKGYRKQIEGEWITKKHPLVGDYAITCSCCGHREHRGPAWNPSWVVHKFCPNCGATMRKEDEGK